MTTVGPHLHDLPPPTDIATALATAPSHTLQDGDRVVGWTDGHAIGFLGFANEHEASGAAWIAYRAITRRLALYSGERPIPIDVEPLALARVGEHEMILASGVPIARLRRPHDTAWLPGGDFGFEIELGPAVSEVRIQSLGHLAYRALRRSGARWQLWDIVRQSPDPVTPREPVAPAIPERAPQPVEPAAAPPPRIVPPADDTPDAMNIIWRALVISAVLVLGFIVTVGLWAAGVVSGASVLLAIAVAGAAAVGYMAWRQSIVRQVSRVRRATRLARLRAARAERARPRRLAPELGGAR
jgi:hypothetical protein